MDIFSPEMITAVSQPEVRLFYAVRLEWTTGWERLHTEIGTFTHFPFDMGEKFFGVGNLGSVGDVTYGDGDNTSPSITLELSIQDDAAREQVLAGGYQGNKGELYLVAFDDVGRVIAWSMQFDGVMDTATLKQGSKNTIQLPLTAPDDALEEGLNWRVTDESQQAQHPGDRIYRYAKLMRKLTIYWGDRKDGIPLSRLK